MPADTISLEVMAL